VPSGFYDKIVAHQRGKQGGPGPGGPQFPRSREIIFRERGGDPSSDIPHQVMRGSPGQKFQQFMPKSNARILRSIMSIIEL
jgi:hypothetical protein